MNIGSTMGSALTTAATGINQGSEQVSRAAERVVEATTSRPVQGTGDIAEAMTDLKQGERSVEMNAKVMQAADKTLGSIIDIQA